MSFNWYIIYTKPKQEMRALLNLERQGYECYLPWIRVDKLKHGNVVEIEEIMFHRYLFINLRQDQWAKSWHPIKSTLGVTSLLTFGGEPQKISNAIIDSIREITLQKTVRKLFKHGDQVFINKGALKGVDGIYQAKNGKDRAVILIKLIGSLVSLNIPVCQLKKLS